MGLYDRIRGNGYSTAKKSIFDCGVEIRKDKWLDVFSASLGRIEANQKACNELFIQDRKPNIDFLRGIIAFGTGWYPVSCIGNEINLSNSWLWGWDNISSLPAKVIGLAEDTRLFGVSNGLLQLSEPRVDMIKGINGYTMSVIACALSQNNLCFYRGENSNGAIYVAFSGMPDKVFSPVDADTFKTIAMQCLVKYHLKQRIFIESFLYQNKTPYEWQGKSIIAHFDSDVRIDFEIVEDFSHVMQITTAADRRRMLNYDDRF